MDPKDFYSFRISLLPVVSVAAGSLIPRKMLKSHHLKSAGISRREGRNGERIPICCELDQPFPTKNFQHFRWPLDASLEVSPSSTTKAN